MSKQPASKAPAATPENTPVPGGGSWRWSDTAPHWTANTPDEPMQPGYASALQTDETKE